MNTQGFTLNDQAFAQSFGAVRSRQVLQSLQSLRQTGATTSLPQPEHSESKMPIGEDSIAYSTSLISEQVKALQLGNSMEHHSDATSLSSKQVDRVVYTTGTVHSLVQYLTVVGWKNEVQEKSFDSRFVVRLSPPVQGAKDYVALSSSSSLYTRPQDQVLLTAVYPSEYESCPLKELDPNTQTKVQQESSLEQKKAQQWMTDQDEMDIKFHLTAIELDMIPQNAPNQKVDSKNRSLFSFTMTVLDNANMTHQFRMMFYDDESPLIGYMRDQELYESRRFLATEPRLFSISQAYHNIMGHNSMDKIPSLEQLYQEKTFQLFLQLICGRDISSMSLTVSQEEIQSLFYKISPINRRHLLSYIVEENQFQPFALQVYLKKYGVLTVSLLNQPFFDKRLNFELFTHCLHGKAQLQKLDPLPSNHLKESMKWLMDDVQTYTSFSSVDQIDVTSFDGSMYGWRLCLDLALLLHPYDKHLIQWLHENNADRMQSILSFHFEEVCADKTRTLAIYTAREVEVVCDCLSRVESRKQCVLEFVRRSPLFCQSFSHSMIRPVDYIALLSSFAVQYVAKKNYATLPDPEQMYQLEEKRNQAFQRQEAPTSMEETELYMKHKREQEAQLANELSILKTKIETNRRRYMDEQESLTPTYLSSSSYTSSSVAQKSRSKLSSIPSVNKQVYISADAQEGQIVLVDGIQYRLVNKNKYFNQM